MKHLRLRVFKIALSAAGLAAMASCSCVHTPPGTSVAVALARRPQLVRIPQAAGPVGERSVQRGLGDRVPVPAVEPALPSGGGGDRVADAYSRGTFCMQAGNDAEAITAFEEAVKLDPSFTEAWQNLAMLYEKLGDEKKALEAFKRSKRIAKE